MAFQRDLELDDLRDVDIREAYAEGRLAFCPGLGPLHCAHCGRSVGLLLPGDALGRTATARTLLIVCPSEFARTAVESGDVVVVVPKIRKVSRDDRARAEKSGRRIFDDCVEAAIATFEAEDTPDGGQ